MSKDGNADFTAVIMELLTRRMSKKQCSTLYISWAFLYAD
jgi:hypothetical protein